MKICEYSQDVNGSAMPQRDITLAECIFYLSCVGYDSVSLWYSYESSAVMTVECMGNTDVQRIVVSDMRVQQQHAIVSFLQYFFDSAPPVGLARGEWQIPVPGAACWNLLPSGISREQWRETLERLRYITRLDRASLAWLASVPTLDQPEFFDAVKYKSNVQVEYVHRRMLNAAATYPEAVAYVKKEYPNLFEKTRTT